MKCDQENYHLKSNESCRPTRAPYGRKPHDKLLFYRKHLCIWLIFGRKQWRLIWRFFFCVISCSIPLNWFQLSSLAMQCSVLCATKRISMVKQTDHMITVIVMAQRKQTNERTTTIVWRSSPMWIEANKVDENQKKTICRYCKTMKCNLKFVCQISERDNKTAGGRIESAREWEREKGRRGEEEECRIYSTFVY